MPLAEWLALIPFPVGTIQEKIAFTMFFIGTVWFFVWVVRLWWKR